jgi:hypothetical protein
MGGVLTGRIAFAPVGLLAFAAALTLGVVAPGGAHAAPGFQYGVAAGEVRAHSAHI